MRFPIIFILLFLFTLTNFPITAFHLMDEAHHGFTTSFSFPKITAKSDVDSIVTPQHIIDKVNPIYLEKTVRDLSSFHTRHTESELIDDVAYWLVEKLQNVCSRDVYIHNFTQISDEDDNVDTQQQQQEEEKEEKMHTYHLKNIVREKPGSTNNTVMISAHYDSRMEDINNSTARAPGADDNASGVSAYWKLHESFPMSA
jgi:hypothetical protein